MSQYIRYGVYSKEEVFPFVVDQSIVRDMKDLGIKRTDSLFVKATEKIYDGHIVKMYSTRYHLFKRSLVCADCGLTASFFALEKDKKVTGDKCHFNLYGINIEGREVLFTQDHIVPVAKGGATNALSNLQTMCCECNHKKADNHTHPEVTEEQHLTCLIREYTRAEKKAEKLCGDLLKAVAKLQISGAIPYERIIQLLPKNINKKLKDRM